MHAYGVTDTWTPQSTQLSAADDDSRMGSLAPTYENVLWLHNAIAMPLMTRTETLALAYKHLKDANALHVQAVGRPSSEALYNMACCFSLAAQAHVRHCHRGTSFALSGLPPFSVTAPPATIIDSRLDLSITAMEAALRAGYSDAANMRVDPDLQCARELRPGHFASLLSKAVGREANAETICVP